MTTREALRSYREKTQDKSPHERVYFFHAHIYYDADDTDEVAKMNILLETLQNDFSRDDHVELHKLQVLHQHNSTIASNETHTVNAPHPHDNTCSRVSVAHRI